MVEYIYEALVPSGQALSENNAQFQDLCITFDTLVEAVEDLLKNTDLSAEWQRLDTNNLGMLRLLPCLIRSANISSRFPTHQVPEEDSLAALLRREVGAICSRTQSSTLVFAEKRPLTSNVSQTFTVKSYFHSHQMDGKQLALQHFAAAMHYSRVIKDPAPIITSKAGMRFWPQFTANAQWYYISCSQHLEAHFLYRTLACRSYHALRAGNS